MNIGKFKNHCCGCGECFSVCPVHAIEMKKNFQGFYYPEVDEKKCIQCGKCVKHCTFNWEQRESSDVLSAYAFKHTDEQIRAESRSGGIFTALSDLVLQSGGVVYGCTLQNCREAVHIRATTAQQRDTCRGSKYIQSKMHDLFHSVRADLESGLWVLFSGTACQVQAVMDFCKGVDSQLLSVDIVCHGVPSPKVWSDYLDMICAKEKKDAAFVDFRDKKRFGWADHKETVVFSDGSVYSGDLFTKMFYSHLILRRDCFCCPYKSLHRCGDISIADCWGINQHYPEFGDDKGISLVLVNTQKGQSFFDRTEKAAAISVDIQNLLQPPLKGNWGLPGQYSEFWSYYSEHSLEKTADQFLSKRAAKKESLIIRVKVKVYRLLKKIRKVFSH